MAVSEKMAIAAFPSNVRRFNNNEISVSLIKSFHDVTVIACAQNNDDWIELFLLLDALRGTPMISLCLTFMGYSRQDSQLPNESFAAGLFAKMLEQMGITRCIIVDNHSEPLIRIPTQHISARAIFEKDILAKYANDQIVIVSPDFGGVRRAHEVARSLKADFVICNKSKNVFGELKKIDTIGSVEDKMCILIDDMVDSGATLCHASESLLESGGRGVVAYCTHAVLSDGSVQRLCESSILEIVLTDSIHQKDQFPTKFRKLSIDSLMVDAIQCIL